MGELWKRITHWLGRAEREREEAWHRSIESYADARIVEHELHQANEDMCFDGDPPYYDVCDAVGDGHRHRSFPIYLPGSATMRQPARERKEA